MVIYSVRWVLDTTLAKGKGRAKSGEFYTAFSVLCRSNKDAIRCLHYHFAKTYPSDAFKFSLDDGEVTLKRSIVDSRHFDFRYLMLEEMKEPIDMFNVSKSLLRLTKLYTFNF